MNIKDKLRQIESISRIAPTRELIVERSDIAAVIDGEHVVTPYGDCFVATKHFDKEYQHGKMPITILDHNNLASLGKDDSLKDMSLNSTIFFDSESTGLSSGTGTYIFLVGFGYFEDSQFIIKQFFLRDFNDEMALLYAIAELLQRFTGIITYNGKCFDVPLLKTRFTYTRLDHNLDQLLHLDLVHTSRRIWKRRLGDCSLGNIERQIIDFHRYDDIPGYLVPQAYFDYLHYNNLEPMVKIFQHNLYDVLSMVTILNKAAAIYQSPLELLVDDQDLVSLAINYKKLKRWDQSAEIYKTLLKKATTQFPKRYLTSELAYCYKRLSNWEHAHQLWNEVIAEGSFDIKPYIELSQYYEHQLRNYPEAEKIIARALNVLDMAEQLGRTEIVSEFKENLINRQRRIKDKQKRLSPKS
jgi:uncharacterized protein